MTSAIIFVLNVICFIINIRILKRMDADIEQMEWIIKEVKKTSNPTC